VGAALHREKRDKIAACIIIGHCKEKLNQNKIFLHLYLFLSNRTYTIRL